MSQDLQIFDQPYTIKSMCEKTVGRITLGILLHNFPPNLCLVSLMNSGRTPPFGGSSLAWSGVILPVSTRPGQTLSALSCSLPPLLCSGLLKAGREGYVANWIALAGDEELCPAESLLRPVSSTGWQSS